MILSAHQPAYLPWLGYLRKIACCDVFVFLDKVQFEKNSFINRNRIKTANGPIWLTVPVQTKGHLVSNIGEMRIDNARSWKDKHLASIYFNYKKCPDFDLKYPRLVELYQNSHALISDLCWDQLAFWVSEFRLNTLIVKQSSLSSSGKKSDLVLELCKQFNADKYISGALGSDYLHEPDFASAGVSIEYQNYVANPYPQLWGDFVPNLSVIDYWFNSSTLKL